MAAINDKEIYNATAVAASETGGILKLDASYARYIELIATNVSGTTPTFDVKVEHSKDGVNFYDLKSFTQITANGKELLALTAQEQPMDNVRVDVVVTGTTPLADLVVSVISDNIK